MKHRALLLCICLIIVFLQWNCSQGPAGADAPAGTGILAGRAVLARLSKDIEAEYDNSGITVAVAGTLLTTQTDRNGMWNLDDVPAGRRTLIFQKAGYGKMVVSNVPVEAGKKVFVYDMPGAQYDAVWLGKLIPLEITDIRMNLDEQFKSLNVPEFKVDIASYPPDSIPMTYSLYFKKNAPPTPEDYDWMQHSHGINQEELWQAGIKPGDSFYVTAIGHLAGKQFLYPHPVTGRIVVSTAVGLKGFTASFVLPPYRK